MKKALGIFRAVPFEVSTALYIIIIGIMTINVNSMVFDRLYDLFGFTGMLAPVIQIISGVCIIFGLGLNKSNLECFGLIVASSIFIIRALILGTDGDLTLQDITAIVTSVLISFASTIRIGGILQGAEIRVYFR